MGTSFCTTSATWTSGGGGGGASFFEQATPAARKRQAASLAETVVDRLRIKLTLSTFTVIPQTLHAMIALLFSDVGQRFSVEQN